MFIAHAPIAYLSNEVVQKKRIQSLNMREGIIVVLCSLFFGILPDFDLFILEIFGYPAFLHHDYIFHTPLFWIFASFMFFIVLELLSKISSKGFSKILHVEFRRVLFLTFVIGVFSHLLADVITSGIMLFWPISSAKFTIFENIFELGLYSGYMFGPLMAFEFVFVVLFIIHIYRKFFKDFKFRKLLSYLLITVSFLYLGFTVFMYLNTYNRGGAGLDIDMDGVVDSRDMDTDNDGVNNLYDADMELLVEYGSDIVGSNKLVSDSSLLLNYGAFNSFRIIDQAYSLANSPITPVLDNYYIESRASKDYVNSYNKVNLLFEYFSSSSSLLELNLDAVVILPEGKILFVLDEDGNIDNVGLTLEDNNIGIVFGNQDRLKMNNYIDLREYYKENIGSIYIQE